jgi:hypothetical protein
MSPLHLPHLPAAPKIKRPVAHKLGTGTLKTKNPFHYLSGSIAAAQKRRKKTNG